MNRHKTIIAVSLIVFFLSFSGICDFASGALPDGLIAYWPLDEGSGSTANDVIDNHDGTLQGGATWVSGKLGSAIDTNNSGYITVPEHLDFRPAAAISLQAWVSVDSFSMWDGIAGNIQDNGSSEAGYSLYTSTSGMDWYVAVNGVLVTAHSTCPLGQWTHFVGTFDGSYVRLYMNGQLEGSIAASGTIGWSFIPLEVSIGRYYDDNELYIADTRIDEVAVWNRALSVDEIGFLYNDGQGNSVTNAAYVQITESDDYTAVEEGGTQDSYEVVLGSEPSDDVEVTATPGDSQIDLGGGAGAAVTLIFTDKNWDSPQTINVTAYDDDVYEGSDLHTTTIIHTATSNDNDYDGISIRSVDVSVADNELTCGDWGYLVTDLNKDCYVNLADFALFASEWLESVPQ